MPTGAKEVFTYRITDGDGDTSEAKFTLDISKVDSTGAPITTGQTITGTANAETINGTIGNDIIDGLGGNDHIYAGAGDDIIIADGNDIRIDGGTGTDTLKVSGNFKTSSDGQLTGVDRVELTAPSAGNRTIADLSNQSEGFRIAGSSGNDKIIGGSGVDVIVGGSGNDILAGGGGNDIITGGTGADQFRLATNSGSDVLRDFNRFQNDKIGLLDNGTGSNGSVNFANTVGTSTGAQLSNSDFDRFNNLSQMYTADTNKVIILQTAHTTATMQGTSIFGQTPINVYVVVFNSSTGKGEIWFDSNWSNTDGRTKVATLENVISLAEVQALTAADFVVYSDANDPVIPDLDGNGVGFSSLEHGVVFDLDGDGTKDKVAWNNTSDGILVYDGNDNGTADDGTELFTPWFQGGSFVSGAEALASLDSNGDGIISAEDEAFSKLHIWQDENGDGITDEGEMKSLSELGIASIDASTTATAEEVDGQTIVGKGTFTREDGSTGTYVEVELDTDFGAAAAQIDSQAEDDLAASLAAAQSWTDEGKLVEARADMSEAANIAEDALDISELLGREPDGDNAAGGETGADNTGTVIELNSSDLDKLTDQGNHVTIIIDGQECDVNSQHYNI